MNTRLRHLYTTSIVSMSKVSFMVTCFYNRPWRVFLFVFGHLSLIFRFVYSVHVLEFRTVVIAQRKGSANLVWGIPHRLRSTEVTHAHAHMRSRLLRWSQHPTPNQTTPPSNLQVTGRIQPTVLWQMRLRDLLLLVQYL